MTTIFVFGSNLAGRHGAGAALAARKQHGAIYGQGIGLQGNSYAIPTKDGRNRAIPLSHPSQTLSLSEIRKHVEVFKQFAREHPDLTFEIVPIGCGLAGYRPNDIAPIFADAPTNCKLPIEFTGMLSN
jgi:hypothetical protein